MISNLWVMFPIGCYAIAIDVTFLGGRQVVEWTDKAICLCFRLAALMAENPKFSFLQNETQLV